MERKFHYGGQAVLEGVMMRGQKSTCTAVRRPSGTILTQTRPISNFYTSFFHRTPFIRGTIVLLETMVLGLRSLLFSANVALEEDDEQISGALVWVMLSVSIGFAVGLFFLVPLLLTNLLSSQIESSLLFHLVEGAVRLIIFVLYLWIIGSMKDIKRTFSYHGAEHKTINAYENGASLEVDDIKKYGTAHTRCGTSFLLSVLVIAVLVFALVGQQELWLMILYRIILLPVIAGIGYEATRLSANYPDNILVRWMRAPGMWLQRLTTNEPDDSQLEVAATALEKVLYIDRVAEEAQSATSSAVSS